MACAVVDKATGKVVNVIVATSTHPYPSGYILADIPKEVGVSPSTWAWSSSAGFIAPPANPSFSKLPPKVME